MELVFLPRESVRDILAILHQQRQPRPQGFSLTKSGNPGDKDLSKGGPRSVGSSFPKVHPSSLSFTCLC